MSEARKNKGGGPKKTECRNQQLAVMCTPAERQIIEEKARKCGMSNSEFFRTLGLKGHITVRTFPKEILHFTGTLNHLAANMNQVARKRNQNDVLDAIERASLTVMSAQIKKLCEDIKNCLQ